MGLARFNPIAGLPRPGQVWSWISFDVANQSFTLIINTLLFPLFFQKVAAAGTNHPSTWWASVFALSMLLVVIVSPFAGAHADATASKKRWLLSTGLSCGMLTCLLGLVPPNQALLAAAIYIPANFLFNLGENFLASFLPSLAPRERLARLSGFSWGVAYAAALLMLVAVAGSMIALSLTSEHQWRPYFVAAGVWFIAFSIPTLLVLREPPASSEREHGMRAAARRLSRTIREASRFRDLAMLLLASFFYGGAMAVVVSFASIIAEGFGFKAEQLVIFTAVITVSGIVGTLIPTFLQDRLGHRRMTLALLGLWLATSLYLAWLAHQRASTPAGTTLSTWPVWLAGNLLGLGLGSLGTANRAFVGYLTPPQRAGEFFGLWGLVFKLAAVLVVPFGIVKDRLGMGASLLVLAGMVVVGMVLTLFVNERRGSEAAHPTGT